MLPIFIVNAVLIITVGFAVGWLRFTK